MRGPVDQSSWSICEKFEHTKAFAAKQRKVFQKAFAAKQWKVFQKAAKRLRKNYITY